MILEKSGVLKIKQTTYYPEGSAIIYYTWEITNISNNVISDLRFFSGGDTYLYGDDFGAGQFIINETTVKVKKSIEGDIQSMDMKGVTTPFAFESQNFYSVYQHIVSNALTDTIDENEFTDNGMALEYRLQSLAPGTCWTINAFENFNTNNLQNIKVIAPSAHLIAPDSSINLNFIIQNYSSSPTNVNLSTSTDISGWSINIESPSSPLYLPAYSAQIVTINVACPTGTAIGTNATITLNANNANGTVSDSCILTVAAVPTILNNPYNINVCTNSTATFDISAYNANTYQWQEYDSLWNNINDNGTYIGTHTPTLNILTVSSRMNNFKYRCLVANSYGNTLSNDATLSVFSAPIINMQPISVSACENENVNFFIDVFGTAINYQWMVNDGTGFKNIINNNIYSGAKTNLLNINSINRTMNGLEFKCFVSGVCNPSVYTESAFLNIFNTPQVSLGNDTILNETETLTLDAGPGSNYIWTNPQLIGRIVTINASILGLGVHTVGVTVFNENNCSSSDSIEITFTFFTGNKETFPLNAITISPNPSSETVTIYFPTTIDEATIAIYNIQGKLLKNEKIFKAINTQIDVSNFCKGTYLFKIFTQHQLIVKKLIVE